ncbi:MAG: hypothetical protein OXC09_13045 [Truepera sp.]|nr:hypothetical protein [Truepera sp.]
MPARAAPSLVLIAPFPTHHFRTGLDTGTFELSVTMVPGGLDTLTSPVEVPRPPSYSDLLDLIELLPRTLAVLRDHLGHYQSYTVTDGDTTYARSLVRLRW